MHISELDYRLPQELIAQYPAKPRDSARLLIVNRKTGSIQQDVFRHLHHYLEPTDVLVFNDTKVIPARLIGKKKNTGGKVEVFLLRQLEGEKWLALVRPSAKVPVGTKIEIHPKLEVEVREFVKEGKRIVVFSHPDVLDLIKKLGIVPLPPYIRRESPDREDRIRYQTIYAKKEGSVAAPTAGLHYTKRVFNSLEKKGIKICYLTLHVGYGTFKPITSERIENHKIDEEEFYLPEDVAETLTECKRNGQRIVAVGTTVTRVLESRFINGRFKPGWGWTNTYIYPPYTFKAVDALQTNFHLPRSSLLALVFAFAGKELIMKAYDYAIQHKFRFYSYGDTMLIL